MHPAPHDQPATAAGRPGGLAPRGWTRLLGVLLVCLLVAACTSPTGRRPGRPSATTGPPPAGAPPHLRTRAWTPAALHDLDTQVPQQYSQVRSVLVVRHGYLVYEHYWHSFGPPTARNSTR
jgi:hypothetical protein